MRLSVIVVSYNVKGYLSLCITSVLAAMEQVGEGCCELFVVDNASDDGSADWVQSAHPQVQLIRAGGNVGFSAANNLALSRARGEWVLLLNPDTIVPEDTFRKILDHVDADDRVGGLGVPMFDGAGDWLPESKRGMPTPWASLCRLSGLWRLAPGSRRLNGYYFGHVGPDETADVEVLSGAFMWMRRSVLMEVGFLDESFFMYGEDIDLSVRILRAGWVNRYYSEAPIVHFKGESTKKGSLSYVRVFHDAMRIFSEKHFAGGQARAMRWMIRLGIRLRAVSAFIHGQVEAHSIMVLDLLLAVLVGMGVAEGHARYAGIDHPMMPRVALVLVGVMATWSVGRWFGTSDRPFHRVRVVTSGLVVATVVLLIYSLLPEWLRMSRLSALLLGVLLGLASGLARMVLVALRPSRFRWRRARPSMGLLASGDRSGDLLEWVRSSYGSALEVVDGRALDEDGRWEVLKSCDLVLQSGDLGGAAALSAIREGGRRGADVRIVPTAFRLALGGNRRKGTPAAGLGWGADGLGRPDRQRAKRRMDLAWSFVILVIGPGQGRMASFFSRTNAFKVLSGDATWLGFHRGWEGDDRLPAIAPGILHAGVGERTDSVSDARRFDLRYASDFGWMRDLELLMNLRMD